MAMVMAVSGAPLVRPQLVAPVARNGGGCVVWDGGVSTSQRMGRKKRTLVSMSALVDTEHMVVGYEALHPIIDYKSTWIISEAGVKNVYMVFSLLFCWGCCVFGAMKDPFYESDDYRDAGGNGTGHWIYDQIDAEEQLARDEMWSEELLLEIEEKVEEIKKAEELKKVVLKD